jgi:hypothetical protein
VVGLAEGGTGLPYYIYMSFKEYYTDIRPVAQFILKDNVRVFDVI